MFPTHHHYSGNPDLNETKTNNQQVPFTVASSVIVINNLNKDRDWSFK